MEIREFAPAIVFVYNRDEHTRKTLYALNENYYVERTDLFIFSDGAKRKQDIESVTKVRNCIKKFKENNKFKSVTIFESEINKGLANSVISGVTYVMNMYEKVIVIEDDLVSSIDFLKYMNEALSYYEAYEEVWSIAGYTPNIKGLNKYSADVYMCLRAGSWGWGTWKNRWDTIDWEVHDYEEFKNNKRIRKAFSKRGADMTKMLDMQMMGKIDSWAIRFCYEQFKQGKLTVNPKISRIKNIGIDGSGTHKVNESKWNVECNTEIRDIVFIPPKLDKKLVRNYYNFWEGNEIKQTLNRIKGFIYEIIVWLKMIIHNERG